MAEKEEYVRASEAHFEMGQVMQCSVYNENGIIIKKITSSFEKVINGNNKKATHKENRVMTARILTSALNIPPALEDLKLLPIEAKNLTLNREKPTVKGIKYSE